MDIHKSGFRLVLSLWSGIGYRVIHVDGNVGVRDRERVRFEWAPLTALSGADVSTVEC